jgi:hypothetical protein
MPSLLPSPSGEGLGVGPIVWVKYLKYFTFPLGNQACANTIAQTRKTLTAHLTIRLVRLQTHAL